MIPELMIMKVDAETGNDYIPEVFEQFYLHKYPVRLFS